MKICLISEYFYPQSTGGTEKYVFELAKRLISEEHEVEIITAGPLEIVNYDYEGISVKVVPPTENFDSFQDIIRNGKYDVLHFHTLTPTFHIEHIAIARLTDAEVYFTAHIPAITCIHGDLMQFGKMPCDGLILKHRCTACYISKRNISKISSNLIAGFVNGLNYPKSTAGAVEKKLTEVSALNRLCHKIFVFTYWQRNIFIKNGFDDTKLVKVQQMESPSIPKPIVYPIVPKSEGKLKLGFVGRLSNEKGLHILISSFLNSNIDNTELHIAAIIHNVEDPYFKRIIKQTEGKSDIFLKFNLDQQAMQDFYHVIDIICIPSIWYETGPYVLYEAFKYQIPVIANNLGDMQIWKEKGYPLELYNGIGELTSILKKIATC